MNQAEFFTNEYVKGCDIRSVRWASSNWFIVTSLCKPAEPYTEPSAPFWPAKRFQEDAGV